jgi:Na+/H+-translocating membrane pyrophosphatase
VIRFFSALAREYGNENYKTNVRTTQAARTSLPQALKVSLVEEPLWDLVLPVWPF